MPVPVRAASTTLVLSGLSLALVGAAPDIRAQENRTWLFGNVSFPAQVDSFAVLGTERWPQPERGTLLKYRTSLAPDATVDVHLQPLPPGGGDPGIVREEFQRTLDELRRYAREGVSVAIDTVHAMPVQAGGWTYDGHVAEATIRGPGTTGRSLAYVFAKPPSFVKIRVTYAAGMRSVLDPRIRAFVAGILERVESYQGRRPPGGGP